MIKHLHFEGTNIKDKEPLIDKTTGFDNIKPSVESLLAVRLVGASTNWSTMATIVRRISIEEKDISLFQRIDGVF